MRSARRRARYGRGGGRRLIGMIGALLWAVPAMASPQTTTERGASDAIPTPRTTLELRASDWPALAAAAGEGRARIAGVRLAAGPTVDLLVERHRITNARTRFVLGRADGRDVPLAYDPDRRVLLRGGVDGRPDAHVSLTLGPDGARGWIELGGVVHPVGRAPRRPAGRPAGPPPAIPTCATEGGTAPEPPAPAMGSAAAPVVRIAEIAVDTDFELYSLFGNADDANDYLIDLYAAVSGAYERDLGLRLELTYVRLWDHPNDLYNEADPLGSLRAYWNTFLPDVPRDLAQLVSGRRDLPYGGKAYLSSLCGPSAYSVIGYVLGFVPDPSEPSVYGFDASVAAHEIGHNCAAGHTHDYGLDTCEDLESLPQRGTIMSYCGQAVSGGYAVVDQRFHTAIQAIIRPYLDGLAGTDCLAPDCNGNGVDDALDITLNGLPDDNGNGVPDGCEDCNGNGLLDPEEIAGGQADDLNLNGRPDACDPDCNENGVPDDLDILIGTSDDLYGNGVPDECEVDCDGDGSSDYTQIQADMALDVDRNARLDACEDCDDDGVLDLEALLGANYAWLADLENGRVTELHPLTGVVTRRGEAGHLSSPSDVVITPGGTVLVASALDHRVAAFDRDGAYSGDFVPAGRGGLSEPGGMVLGPDGDLYVASRGTDSVLRYDGADGSFVGTFVSPGAGGLEEPFGLTFGAGGDLFVTSATNEVLRYAGADGSFVGMFVAADDNGGLTEPRGILFGPSTELLVASFGTDEVLAYNGATGAFRGRFDRMGTELVLTLDGPWCLRLGPDGNLYVSRHDLENEPAGGGHFLSDPVEEVHLNRARIYALDGASGNFLRTYAGGADSGIFAPTGFDFFPDTDGIDCNLNARPDACDILTGRSADVNANGLPDECECPADVDGNGAVSFGDILTVLEEWGACDGCAADIDANGVVGLSDLLVVLVSWGGC